MKLYELINFNRGLLENLQDAGIRLSDVRYVELFAEYQAMRSEGLKVSYIVAVLAERYGVCERKVYDLLKRFRRDCTPVAV